KKSLLPDYDVFDEYRYFEPNRSASCIEIGGEKIALTVCEDLWDDEVSNSYVGDFMAELRKENPSLIINIAASPFSYTHFENRSEERRVGKQCRWLWVLSVLKNIGK